MVEALCCPSGLFLMALGMSGLGYAAQQVAANVFKTDKSAEVPRLSEGAADELEVGKAQTIKPFELVPATDNHGADLSATCSGEVTCSHASSSSLMTQVGSSV